MLLLLDNHDSFTWNLVELLRRIDKGKVNIMKHEAFRMKELSAYDRIIFSPGPGLPDDQKTMFDILDHLIHPRNPGKTMIPVFGVCLGMQALVRFFGGTLYNLPVVNHGQPRHLRILHPEHGLFREIREGTTVGLYHSWAADPGSLPDCLEVLAVSEEDVIMAISHKTLPICGVQFHPESIITADGKRFLENWLAMR